MQAKATQQEEEKRKTIKI